MIVVTLTIQGYCAIIVINVAPAHTTWTGGRDEDITCKKRIYDKDITRKKRIYDESPYSNLHVCMIGNWEKS